MKLSLENIRILYLLVTSFVICVFRMKFFEKSQYIRRILTDPVESHILGMTQTRTLLKSVKGMKKMTPLLRKKSRCLMEALIVKRVLDRLGIPNQFHIGSKKSEELVIMHAWLSVEGKTVVGGPVAEYNELIRIR